jgi:hypothetical protein
LQELERDADLVRRLERSLRRDARMHRREQGRPEALAPAQRELARRVGHGDHRGPMPVNHGELRRPASGEASFDRRPNLRQEPGKIVAERGEASGLRIVLEGEVLDGGVGGIQAGYGH